jgi:hypothetical protein
VLPLTDHRYTSAGHRQHLDAQDDKSIEDGCTADITQDVRDSSQAGRVHPHAAVSEGRLGSSSSVTLPTPTSALDDRLAC